LIEYELFRLRIIFERSPKKQTMVLQNADILSTEKAILDALTQAKEKGTMIGIHAPALGTGTYITGISDIVTNDHGTSVITKGYDITGYILKKSTLQLSEIKSVIPFTSVFNNKPTTGQE
jgi:hypothetical protein